MIISRNVVVASINSMTLLLWMCTHPNQQCSIPSCHHICCCCHADSCQWVSSPDLVLNESSCLHCQLFECNNCCSTVASITTPFPAILSLLPNFHLYWFHPACWAHESFCILSFDDTNKPLNSSPLLQSLLATRYCPQCRKNLNITFFIYVEETLMQSEAFQELRRCLPATRIVVIQTHHKTTPLAPHSSIKNCQKGKNIRKTMKYKG